MIKVRGLLRLEHVSKFKYLGCVLDELSKDEAECLGMWRVEGGLQALLGLWLMLGVWRLGILGSCMSHCSCLFLCMVVRQ